MPENIDFENPGTLGLQLVNILVDQLNDEIKLKRDKGTEFVIGLSAEEKRNNKKDRPEGVPVFRKLAHVSSGVQISGLQTV